MYTLTLSRQHLQVHVNFSKHEARRSVTKPFWMPSIYLSVFAFLHVEL